MSPDSFPTLVTTVTGPVPVEELGTTLFHEHLFLSNEAGFRPAPDTALEYLRDRSVSTEDLAFLREFPYASLDNLSLDEPATLRSELKDFAGLGGRTIVEVTGWNSGRSPVQLRELSEATGIQIVMGCGLYRERSHPEWVKTKSISEISALIIAEIQQGVPADEGSPVKPGVIGEVGVSKHFPEEEQKSLRAASLAQIATGVPLSVHLPGWERRGHEVVDICLEMGVSPDSIVLSHMDPSSKDADYQSSLADRGVYLEFDGIGMGLYLYREKQCPSDDEIASAVARLVEGGHADQVLLSQDVYLKILWRKYGGNGYSHVLRSFMPRLIQKGLSEAAARSLVERNPMRVFKTAQNI